jgi:hypothetical protein
MMTAIARTDVDVSSTQALTNKTVSLGSNTISGTLAQFNTAVSDADLASIAGTETLTGKTLTSPKVNQINDTGGAAALAVTATASGVNYVTVAGTASGGATASFTATGSDANIFLSLRGKGSYGPILMAGGSNLMTCYAAAGNTNYFSLQGAASGGTPFIQAVGETNVSFNIRTSGTGTVQANGNPVGVKVAVPASASATGVVGQWAADSSWIYVCTAANTWVRGALATW